MRLTLLVLCAVLIAATPALAAPREITVREDALGPVTVLAPHDEPARFVALLSDHDGPTPAMRSQAEALAGAGAAVALIDTPALLRGLALGSEQDCHYAFGDIEDVARSAQRSLGMRSWRWPVMLGLGEEGGTLAYLALAQAPLNTAAGAVSLGFSPRFASKLKLCEGAPGTKSADAAWTYAPLHDVPGRWVLVSPADPGGTEQSFLTAAGGARSFVVGGDDGTRFAAAAKAALEIATQPKGELGDLPLVELPTDGTPRGLVIFLSGDGGWRDIDETVGAMLQKQGIAVVGIDSLRYFWSTKEPEVIAADIDRVIDHYTKIWGTERVAVAGYSLGADVIPFAWPKLAPQTRKAVDLIVLLGLEPTADFEISVAGWLGVASSSDVAVRPHLSALPAGKTMCIYGKDEVADEGTACVFQELSGATLVERPGGHHFDGDYGDIARMILDRLTARETAVR
jgi:type IV secretory pathway VirJ component